MYMVRSEWGANANLHIHRHVISEAFSRFSLQLELQKRRVEFEIRADDPLLESDVSRSAIDTRLDAAWRDCQRQYIARIERCYTNWNAGSTKDGERTYDFAYNRKTTVRCARMASLWTCDALPPDFERLSPRDFDVDGISLWRRSQRRQPCCRYLPFPL